MRIFLDANILFSAANPSSAIRQLLNMARTAGHECWADEHVIREAHRNLFLKQRERIPDFERLLADIRCATKLSDLPLRLLDETSLPENDRRALAAAIALECDAFVTGDQTHFGPLYGKTVAAAKIYSPRQLAEVFVK
jgi:predicted nucleic acid-binding protein